MADEIKCKHCGERRAPLGFAPLPTELGQRVGAEICQVCWRDWLQKQTQIINHYGLDLMNPDAQEFLFANMKGHLFFFYDTETSEIYTAKEGAGKW